MLSTTFLLVGYSIISTLVVLTLSILYHNCGRKATIQDHVNNFEKNEYEIGIVITQNNVDGTDCSCWMSLEYTMLEVIVMITLGIVGAGLLVKLTILMRLWLLKRAETARERKVLKAEKMRKIILEEYRAEDPVQSIVQEDFLCIRHEGREEN